MARAKSESTGVTSKALRDRALGDLDALILVTTELRKDLRSYQTALEKSRRHLDAGGPAFDMTSLFDVASVRSTLSNGLDRVERARNVSRRSLWRLQLSEGRSIAEIARAWGFSRQLVSRALAGKDSQS